MAYEGDIVAFTQLSAMKLLLLSLVCVVFSCSNTRQDSNQKIDMDTCDQIVYHFQDASVPPPYHRSYVITVREGESHVVVDSYGDVLADTSYALSAAAWENLRSLTADLQKPGRYEAKGATGTSGNLLTLYSAGKEIYSLYWDSLSDGRAKEGALVLVSALKETVPDLMDLTR